MRVRHWAVLLLLGCGRGTPPEALAEQSRQGPLVIVGGGVMPEGILERTLALAGGPEAKVVVLPQASSSKKAGIRMGIQFPIVSYIVVSPTFAIHTVWYEQRV